MNEKIPAQYWVTLKGKQHPLYTGVLDAAFKDGLRSISVEMLQFPAVDNGMLAVARATASFEDGRCFEEIGDASPENVGRHIAPHICRMAATRAKGRALRDALNLGVALAEELMDDDDPRERVRTVLKEREKPLPIRHQQPEETYDDTWALGKAACNYPGCGRLLTEDEIKGCRARSWPKLCAEHGKEHKKTLQAVAEKEAASS